MTYHAGEDPSLVDTATLRKFLQENPGDHIVVSELEKRENPLRPMNQSLPEDR